MARATQGVLLPPHAYQANICHATSGTGLLRECHSAAAVPLGPVHAPRASGEHAIITHGCSSHIPRAAEGIGLSAAILLFHFLTDCALGSL